MRRVVKPSRLRALGLLSLVTLLLRPGTAAGFDMQGSEIELEIVLPDEDGELTRLNPNEEDQRDHFNKANCECSNILFGARATLKMPAPSYEDDDLEFFAGFSCDVPPADIELREDNCVKVETLADVEVLRTKQVTVPIAVRDLVAPNENSCPLITDTNFVYAVVDEQPDGIEEGDYVAPLLEIPFDLEPPPAPDSISAAGAENAIQIEWDLPDSRAEDIRFFQVLCARADGTIDPTDGFPRDEPEYLTSLMACGEDFDGAHPTPVALSAAAAGVGVDAGPEPDAMPSAPDAGFVDPSLPDGLFDLDPATLCGESSGTDTGLRVTDLENGVPYRVVLLSIDNYQNVTALDLGEHTPESVQDAWEHYKESGGSADGGYCFVATATFGNYDHPFVRILRTFRDDTLAPTAWGRAFIRWYYDNSPALAAFIAEHPVARAVSYVLLAPLVAFAAVWEYTGLLGKLALLLVFAFVLVRRRRRRSQAPAEGPADGHPGRPQPRPRRRRALAAAIGALLLLGISATAHAQPYWDELNEPIADEDAVPNWNFEAKFGPYFPNIDDEFGGSMGPFEEMFGGSQNLMSILVLDRFFSFPSGQLGVTASLGFTRHRAKAFQIDRSGNVVRDANGDPVRSSGDSTQFRLVPTSLGAVYRFTDLDDKYRIPIVPYAKASLAYYLWWFTDPNGNISESRTMDCPNAGDPGADCDGNLARGGSLGFQGSLGVAIRAERLDPSAELSLRTEMGIEHAGFFAELQLAQVDGFGAEDKLSVGDTTWFGGINFEF